MKVLKCDRCGKELDDRHFKVMVNELKPKCIYVKGSHQNIDLCPECGHMILKLLGKEDEHDDDIPFDDCGTIK